MHGSFAPSPGPSLPSAVGKGASRLRPGALLSGLGCALALASAPASPASAADAAAGVRLEVRVDRPGAAVSPTMWGVFFEDINYGADGGLYPERVKNRSFEFPNPLMGWRELPAASGAARAEVVDAGGPSANQPHFLRLRNDAEGPGTGVENEGFFGMGVERGAEYVFSVEARSADPVPPALGVEIVGADGGHLAGAVLKGTGASWGRLEHRFRLGATDPKARLRLRIEGKGTLDLDLVSLFPVRTWKNRPGGLRADLVQWLADLKPGFVRFPGGCIVEGHYLSGRYQWKKTVGPVRERPLLLNRWNDEFKHRPAPDYFQSFGLGFFEYFQLCEDIGAQPLPILNCGMACQFNSGELVPLDQLDPYVQDALDLIEFANGPATSRWGSLRAEMGHPAPFGMRLLGVGNEQWGPQYLERYAVFARELKARHPEVRLVSSAGPGPADERFQFLWPKLRELNADIIDEHCYDRPAWFLDSARRYDGYSRTGPRVFMGEYAAQSDKVVSVLNRNNLECAIAEAAFLTGLERNADVVVMSSYAPLFGNEEGWQWRPNLIWCDNLRSYGTPNYYVQQAFSRNPGDHVLPLEIRGQEPATAKSPGLYASAVRDEAAKEVILKVVNSAADDREAVIDLRGAGRVDRSARATVLTSGALADENSLGEPRKVAPVESRIRLGGASWTQRFPRWSLTVLRIPTRP